MTEAIVFIGPTLDRRAARRIAAFDFRPPAAQGDVYRAVRERPRAIGIVDGVGDGAAAVWHKEVLFALSSGIHVFGAAAAGALRAAELAPFGMRPVGRIANWFCEGTIEDDDEVAVAHGPADVGFARISEPLVNIRATLASAAADGALSTADARRLLATAKAMFYKERTWNAVLAAGRAELRLDALATFASWLPSGNADLGSLDAELLLKEMALLLEQEPEPFQPRHTFESTAAWEEGVAAFEAAERDETERRILAEARLDPVFAELRRAAALRCLAMRDHAPEQSAASDRWRTSRFRLERDLLTPESLKDWLDRNGLDETSLAGLLARREAESALLSSLDRSLGVFVLDETRLRGLYEGLAARAAAKKTALDALSIADASIPPSPALLQWYFEQRLGRAVPEGIDSFLASIGIAERAEFYELLAAEFIFESLPQAADTRR